MADKETEKRPDWMTSISATVKAEDYILGRKVDKTFELSQQEKADRAREARIDLIANNKIKLSHDPILDLERRRRELKMELISNPVKLRQFRERLLQMDRDKQIVTEQNVDISDQIDPSERTSTVEIRDDFQKRSHQHRTESPSRSRVEQSPKPRRSPNVRLEGRDHDRRPRDESRSHERTKSRIVNRSDRSDRHGSRSHNDRYGSHRDPHIRRRSRSPSPTRTRHRSRSPSLPRNKYRSRSPSLPRNKYRSRSPSLPRSKYRSRSPSLPRHKYRSRSPSITRTRHQSRPSPVSRDRRRSRSPAISRNRRQSRSPSVPRRRYRSRSPSITRYRSPSQSRSRRRSSEKHRH